MTLKKNWFYNLSIPFASIFLTYILISGVITYGEGREYPYFLKGLVLLCIVAAWTGMRVLFVVASRFRMDKILSNDKKWVFASEGILVALIIVIAAWVRITVVRDISVTMSSTEKIYYDIASYLKAGTLLTEGSSYTSYVSMFPNVIGYSYILKLAFSVFGESIRTGQYLNVAFSVATIFISYKIGRKLGGRIAGFITLLMCSFWPSQILYINILSPEYAFTFLLYLCIWILISSVMDYDASTSNATRAILLHLLLGILLAATGAIKPIAYLLPIVMIIYLLPQKMKLPNIPRNDLPLVLRTLEKGWLRGVIILIPFFIMAGFINTNIEVAIDRDLPPSSALIGYHLLSGLNTESVGQWNQTDSDYLFDTLEMTNSATKAQIACRDLAIERLGMRTQALLNLLMNKYEIVWANDNFAFWTYQSQSTDKKIPDTKLNMIMDLNQLLYLSAVVFSLLHIIGLWNKNSSYSYLLILIYLGVLLVYLFLDIQNVYHFGMIQAMILLNSLYFQGMYREERDKQFSLQLKENAEISMLQTNSVEPASYREVDTVSSGYQRFDMREAIRNGNIIMTVSQAYRPYPETAVAAAKEENETGATESVEGSLDGTIIDVEAGETSRMDISSEDMLQREDTREEVIPKEVIPEEVIPKEVIPEEVIPVEAIPVEAIPEEAIPEEVISDKVFQDEAAQDKVLKEEEIPKDAVLGEAILKEIIQEEVTPEEVLQEEINPEVTLQHVHKSDIAIPDRKDVNTVQNKNNYDEIRKLLLSEKEYLLHRKMELEKIEKERLGRQWSDEVQQKRKKI